jgi:hypothetical protein
MTLAMFRNAAPAHPSHHPVPAKPAKTISITTGSATKDTASRSPAGTAKGSSPHAVAPDGSTPHALPPRPKGVLCGELPAKTQRWKSRQGPLTLAGSVVIGPGATLVVGEGTEVRIAANDSCPESDAGFGKAQIALIVRGGTLRVAGTSQRPVVFKALSTSKGFGWEGIRVEKASKDGQADLRWFELSNASIGIAYIAGAGRIEHGMIDRCGIGITSVLGASPLLRHSVVSRSAVADLVSSRSATRVVSCLFVDGEGDGIRFDGTGLSEVRTSCFWNHRGTEITNGPPGLGNWSIDTLPDVFGNWQRDPVLRNSGEHQRLLAEFNEKMSALPWWKPRRAPENPPGRGPFALSPFSPLVDKGESLFCSDPDGSKCDIGLWGGP